MASTTTTELFYCSPKEFYKIVSDYESYPEFLPEVKECSIIEKKGKKKLVEFKVAVIKSFSYRLWMTETKNKKLEWEFESGDLFKTSTGSWELEEDEDGFTLATYSVEGTFKMFIPGAITKTLINVNLPSMMKAYHKRVDEFYHEES